MGPRIALLGMILESNRFAAPATRADFESLTWLEGAALMAEARAETPSLAPEFAAFVRAMDATGPWQPVPCLLAASHPAGPVEEAVFEEAAGRVETLLAEALAGDQGPLDAVLICNHGAMVATHVDDPDGALASRVRRVVGNDTRLVMTLDLHANISPAMVDAVDLIVGYRTNPHVDMIERGEEAAFSLRRMLAPGAARPKTSLVRPPITPASVTLLTADGPYGDLIDLGQRRQAEMGGAILNVSVFGNFVFSDVPDNSVSVVVTARAEQAAADALAAELAEAAWAMRHRFVRNLTPIEDAVALALAPDRAPVIFSDAGDNPGGGGSGRTTDLLRALIEAGAEGVLYGSYHDPELAAEAHAAGVGARFTARFNRSRGNAPWEQWDTPLEVDAEVVGLGDGAVIGELGQTAGRRLHLGQSAALRIEGVTVVVISDRTQTADPVFFHMLGLDVGAARTVVVKSRGHFRAGFGGWFPPTQVFEIDTAGLTSPVLERWPFERLPRPSFPLDPETVWSGTGPD
ncbi:MAG: M81 family metallopeptidase [Pseudomonadota bacterium]